MLGVQNSTSGGRGESVSSQPKAAKICSKCRDVLEFGFVLTCVSVWSMCVC